MFPWHRRDPQTRRVLCTRLALHLDHHLLIRVESVHLREVVIVAFGGEVAFRVRRADDRQVATERLLDFLVEVVASLHQYAALNITCIKGRRPTRDNARAEPSRCAAVRAGRRLGLSGVYSTLRGRDGRGRRRGGSWAILSSVLDFLAGLVRCRPTSVMIRIPSHSLLLLAGVHRSHRSTNKIVVAVPTK